MQCPCCEQEKFMLLKCNYCVHALCENCMIEEGHTEFATCKNCERTLCGYDMTPGRIICYSCQAEDVKDDVLRKFGNTQNPLLAELRDLVMEGTNHAMTLDSAKQKK